MKDFTKNFLYPLILCLTFCTNGKRDLHNISHSNFDSPANNSKLHTWWHWMQGNITREGITQDLEAMKANGIVQATILNIGLIDNKPYGVNRVVFNTPEWHSMFRWALEEANRLGIKIGAHNSDGWSSSGGPWIKPEQSMKVLTWNKTYISNTTNDPIQLFISKPAHNLEYYEDVATFAVPTDATPSNFARQKPKFYKKDSLLGTFLLDGSMTGGVTMYEGDEVIVKLEKPIEVNSVSIVPLKPFTWAVANTPSAILEISQSQDGKVFKPIGLLTIVGYNTSRQAFFAPVKAPYFSIKVKQWPGWNSFIEFQLAEVEFLSKNEKSFFSEEIENIQVKTAYVRGAEKKDYQYLENKDGISPQTIQRLSTKQNPDGTSTVTIPKGTWEIYRMGYTTSKAKNAPATAEGEGLECDKLDTHAVNFHFRQFPQKLIETGAELIGKSFAFLLIDSWECGFQNWTKNFPEEFKKRRGYDIEPYYPVLVGVNIGSTAESEAFLYDFRLTLADMLREYYYGHFAKLCHKNKLEMHAEVIYGSGMYPPIDILKTNQLADMPMFEFWAGHNSKTTISEYTPKQQPNLDFPMSAAFFYDKPIVSAEAYTAMAHYSETLFDLKPFGDQAYMSGVNQFILHSYVHQPHSSVPGFTLGMFGSHFNRHNPSFVMGKSWSEYHARVQTVLQQSTMHADILYYIGDQLPQTLEDGNKNIAPPGFQSLICNTDVLMNKLTVKGNKLWYKGIGFSVLYLPENIALTLTSLRKIKELADLGVVLCGSKPTFVGGVQNLKENTEAFQSLLADFWPSFGKQRSNIVEGKNLLKALAAAQLTKDVDFKASDTVALSFAHRVAGNQHIYFVSNQTASALDASCTFRQLAKQAELWNPVLGTRCVLHTTPNAGTTSISLRFKPYESFFIVFGQKEDEQVPKYSDSQNFVPIILNQVKIRFDGLGAPAPIQSDTLPDFRYAASPDVKYFSGYIDYEITFQLKNRELASNFTLLSLGDFASAAAVTLNGVDLGYVWSPDYPIPTQSALKVSNILRVRVGTTWRNRIIGELTTLGSLQQIWTTQHRINHYLNAQKPLRISGIKGPIRISN